VQLKTDIHGDRVVAIDGPSGSGKSTVAKLVAARLGYPFLDTGAIYRSVALYASERGVAWDDEAELARLARSLPLRFEQDEEGNRVMLADRDVSSAIRTPQISGGASKVSAHPAVRHALLELQRSFAGEQPLVAEGRDVGTVVFPRAVLKIFLMAAAGVRMKRRHEELKGRGHRINAEEVERLERERDQRDEGREVAPLRAAEDAVMIDTSDLSIDQVVEHVVQLAQKRL
jgi:cytidylate kinase